MVSSLRHTDLGFSLCVVFFQSLQLLQVYICPIDRICEMYMATVTSPFGLWFTSSSLKDNNLPFAIFNVLLPEVTVSGSRGGFLS